MKKVLILASLIAFTGLGVMADEAKEPPKAPQGPTQFNKMPPKQQKIDFDKRLKLTDEQKTQAEELRKQGREQIKPLMEESMAKRKEIKAAIDSNKDYKTVEKLKGELREIDKKAHEIRKQNMKDFESILTKKQQKELEKIKKEGRKKFEQEHKNRPPRGPKPEFKPQIVLP